jgi:glycosyltransferase involved in cell wall biosynthesis
MNSPQSRDPAAEPITVVAHDVGGIGGMERQLEVLVCGLLERGRAVIVVSRVLDLPDHPALRWRRVRGPARPFTIAYPWFATVASLMLLRRARGPLHVTGAIVFARADVCTVHYVHNGSPNDVVRARRSTPFFRLNARFARAMSCTFERWLYRRKSLIRQLVAVSEPAAEELVRIFPERAEDVCVVENGVDTTRFHPTENVRRGTRSSLGVRDDEFLALFVGSDWPLKGLDLIVQAISGLPTWHLCVIGDGDRARLVGTARECGVVQRVHIVGETAEPERYYAAADAFVLPSAYESFSLAALEAAASGVPVVATRVGIVESLAAAEGGILIDRDSESIASALDLLAADPDLRERMARSARAQAQRFDWSASIDAYLRLYAGPEGCDGAAVAVSGGRV